MANFEALQSGDTYYIEKRVGSDADFFFGNGAWESDSFVNSISYYSTGTSLNNGITLELCTPIDSDSDDIPDMHDTDSDNDGCADAVEAAGTFTTTNLDSNNSLGDDVATSGADIGTP